MKASAGNRILMLLENCPYPQDARVRREARTLTEAGYDVTVICPSGKNQPRREEIDGVRVHRFPAPGGGNGLVGYLWEYGFSTAAIFVLSCVVFLQRGFDVIHAHNPPDTMVFIAAFYKLLGKRFVFDHHDLSPEMYHARFRGGGNRWVQAVLVWLERWSCRLADRVIATNESYRALEIERHGIPEGKVSVVRNGPDLTRVCRVAEDPQLRARAATIVGYVGTLGYQDGVDYLIRAIHRMVHDLGRKDVLCVIIGRGDAADELAELTASLALEEHVWLTGFVTDAAMLAYLSTADICADPDPSNPFNDRSTMIKMMEYMALGKPIVAFDLPEHRVTAQDAALYVKDNDELEFARAIVTLADDPERRRAMGRCGQDRVRDALSWDHQSESLLEVYRSLAPLVGDASLDVSTGRASS